MWLRKSEKKKKQSTQFNILQNWWAENAYIQNAVQQF